MSTIGLVTLLVGAASMASPQIRYDNEYPPIEYSTRAPNDPVAELIERIDKGRVELAHEAERGYLDSLLQHLEIPVSSQVLVFTKTSLQKNLVSPRTPRAIYFNDDTYVAWLQGSDVLEISAIDPMRGAAFYTLAQQPGTADFQFRLGLCLECHDSYSLTGGGVPRNIMGSGVPDERGEMVYHEGWLITDDRTPFRLRWGGWYVTGTLAAQSHMGNMIVPSGSDVSSLDFTATRNLTDVSHLVDLAPYPSPHSDLVALMVLEHQVHVQNLITRTNYDVRTALHGASLERTPVSSAALREMEEATEPLVRAMLFVDEAPLEGPATGTSTYSEEFEARGPFDEQGRSLRQLDLRHRLFRYPLSYLIYSAAFDALPGVVKDHVFGRLRAVLGGEAPGADFDHISVRDAEAILQILRATKADFASAAH